MTPSLLRQAHTLKETAYFQCLTYDCPIDLLCYAFPTACGGIFPSVDEVNGLSGRRIPGSPSYTPTADTTTTWIWPVTYSFLSSSHLLPLLAWWSFSGKDWETVMQGFSNTWKCRCKLPGSDSTAHSSVCIS